MIAAVSLCLPVYAVNAETAHIGTDKLEGTIYFISNEQGIAIKQIAKYRQDEFAYVLAVSRKDNVETRNLFHENSLVRRTERLYANTGKIETEKNYAKGRLTSVTVYNSEGRIKNEEFYNTDGAVTYVNYYTYRKGRLHTETRKNSEDKTVYEEQYWYTSDGRIRKVKRTFAEGDSAESIYTYNSDRLAQEWHENREGRSIRKVYSRKGKILLLEEWKKDTLLTRESREYKNGNPAESVLKNFSEKKAYIRTYAGKDNTIAKETVYQMDASGKIDDTERIALFEYTHNEDGLISSKVKKSENRIERWNYIYNGEKKAEESYTVNGVLQYKLVFTGEDSYYKDLYSRGNPVLRVYYKDEEAVREEILQNGEIIRTRERNTS